MYIEPENERETLEDKVYDLYPQLDMTEIQRMTDEQLSKMVERANGKTQGKPNKPGKPAKPPKLPKPLTQRWSRLSVDYQIRNGELVQVETWRKGTDMREKIKPCGNRVTYEGERLSAVILKHYLMTGQWVKRVPKSTKKHKAVVSANGKSLHLGYFATVEEKELAIFQYKMGIFAKKA